MISFFPKLYPDELIYSAIARYHKYSGNLAITDSVRDLFGINRTHASAAFTRRIGFLANQTQEFGINFDELLINHTFFPVYTVFQSQEVIKKTVEWALKDTSFIPPAILGVSYPEAEQITHLRYCSQCLQQEKLSFGEGYWHRIHQLPGVLVCAKHECLLQESNVPITSDKHNDYVCIEDACAYPKTLNKSMETRQMMLAIKVAQNYEWLIQNYSHIRDQYSRDEEFRKTYLYILMQRGYTTKHHAVRAKIFLEDFQTFYGELLKIWDAEFRMESQAAWPKKMYRLDRMNRSSVLRHILFSIFLADGLSQVMQNCVDGRFCERTAIIYSNPVQFSEKRKNYRAVWKEKRNENPNSSPAELHQKAPNVYIWLNRHDKEWLKKNTPALRIRNPNRTFADWNALDKIILKSYQTAFNHLIRSDQRPVRISKEQLSLAAGYKSYVSSGKKLSRLPLTAAFLSENVETRDAYRKRKIVWAARELEKDNIAIFKYKLMRKAAIPDRMTTEYWIFYENEMRKGKLQPIE